MSRMSGPTAFLFGTVLALGLGLGGVLASFRLQYGLDTVDSAGRCRSVQEKVDLARSLPLPKIVFVGGSSVHWGINAERAGKALNRDGLNFGTFAALGPEIILWEAREVLRPGDIAVLAFEYNMYAERSLTTDAISYALGCDESFLAAMRAQDYAATALASDPLRPFHVAWRLWNGAGGKNEDGPLDRSQHGDPVASSFKTASAELRRRVGLYSPLTIRVEEDSTIARAVESFSLWARDNGVKVYATWPNTIAFDAYERNPVFDRIRRLYADNGIAMIGEPMDAMYPATLFYDTQYHLSAAGIERRTNDLLNVLKPRLDADTAGPSPRPYVSGQQRTARHEQPDENAAN